MTTHWLDDWERAQARLERRRWLASSMSLLMAGAAVALVLQGWSTTEPPRKPPAAPMVVELAVLPQANAAPIAAPEGPRRTEAPKATAEPRPQPEVPPLPAADVALPEAPPVPAEASPETPAAETTAPAAAALPQAPVSAAPLQSATATISSAAQISFRQRLLGHLERHKRYPQMAQQRRQQGVPYIRFRMDRQGRVLSAALERSSGFASLDAEALSLPARAQPLPSLPEDIPGETLEIVVPIEFLLRR